LIPAAAAPTFAVGAKTPAAGAAMSAVGRARVGTVLEKGIRTAVADVGQIYQPLMDTNAHGVAVFKLEYRVTLYKPNEFIGDDNL
jgi:hypothetical protein